MNLKAMAGGEGASTFTFGSSTVAMPSVVMWPACMHGSVPFEASQEIYRVAYEWALTMLRPSGYELATRFAQN
jgi:hypothetical protein